MENLFSISTLLILAVLLLIFYIGKLKGWFGKNELKSIKALSINLKEGITKDEADRILQLLNSNNEHQIPKLEKVLIREANGGELYMVRGPLPPVPPVPAPLPTPDYLRKVLPDILGPDIKFVVNFEIKNIFSLRG